MQLSSHAYNQAAFVGLVLLLITSCNIDSADGLSDTICNNIEAEWQTDEPRLKGAFPFYTLLGKLLRAVLLSGIYVNFPSL